MIVPISFVSFGLFSPTNKKSKTDTLTDRLTKKANERIAAVSKIERQREGERERVMELERGRHGETKTKQSTKTENYCSFNTHWGQYSSLGPAQERCARGWRVKSDASSSSRMNEKERCAVMKPNYEPIYKLPAQELKTQRSTKNGLSAELSVPNWSKLNSLLRYSFKGWIDWVAKHVVD